MALHPTSELVAVAWLKTLSGLTAGNIATTLPKDVTSWATAGFVQVTAVGGSPNRYVPVANPVVSVDCWATAAQAANPPWYKANQLAEIIRTATLAHTAFPVLVDPPGTYNPARVHTAFLITEPRRVTNDPAGYARFTCDLQLAWVEVAS